MFPLRDWYPPVELQGRPEEEEAAAEIGPCCRVARQGMCMQSQGCGMVETKIFKFAKTSHFDDLSFAELQNVSRGHLTDIIA